MSALMSPMSSNRIPHTQRAAIVAAYGGNLVLEDSHPVLQPDELLQGECLIKLECSGVCHSDVTTKNGRWADIGLGASSLPIIPGHEGVGRVVTIGEHTANSDIKIGDRVGLKWIAYACLRCEWCRSGNESSCPRQKVHGYTVDGTFQEYVKSYVDYVTPIPDSIESAAAASILCAGVAVYRGLKQTNTVPGNWIAIPGAGGGLGHLAVQYAVNRGLRVIAIDTGLDKRNLCRELGAEIFIDYKESADVINDVRRAAGEAGPHAALVTAAGGMAYRDAVAYLRLAGTLVCVGMPPDAMLEVEVNYVIGKSLKIVGSADGNRQDAIEALDIAARGKVRCRYQFRAFEDLNEVLKDMERGRVAGRVVINYN